MEPDEIIIRFRYRYSSEETAEAERLEKFRHGCLTLAHLFNRHLEDSRELSLAITKLEEAMFWANAGIARGLGL